MSDTLDISVESVAEAVEIIKVCLIALVEKQDAQE